jgi:mycoredoxin
METQLIKVYGTTWCGDCRRAKAVFAEMGIPYLWFDIDHNLQAAEFVKQTNQGMRSVPTIIFPDGSILVEPDSESLREKLRDFQHK